MKHYFIDNYFLNGWSTFLQSWLPFIAALIALIWSLCIASHSFKKEKYFHKQKIVEEIVGTLFLIDIHLNTVIAQTTAYLEAKKRSATEITKNQDILSGLYLQEFNSKIIRVMPYIQIYFSNIHSEWDLLQEVLDQNTNILGDIIHEFNSLDEPQLIAHIEKMNNEFRRLWNGFEFKMTNSLLRELKKEQPKAYIFW